MTARAILRLLCAPSVVACASSTDGGGVESDANSAHSDQNNAVTQIADDRVPDGSGRSQLHFTGFPAGEYISPIRQSYQEVAEERPGSVYVSYSVSAGNVGDFSLKLHTTVSEPTTTYDFSEPANYVTMSFQTERWRSVAGTATVVWNDDGTARIDLRDVEFSEDNGMRGSVSRAEHPPGLGPSDGYVLGEVATSCSPLVSNAEESTFCEGVATSRLP